MQSVGRLQSRRRRLRRPTPIRRPIPMGSTSRCSRFAALERAWRQARQPGANASTSLRTCASRDASASTNCRQCRRICRAERWTVDEPADLEVVDRGLRPLSSAPRFHLARGSCSCSSAQPALFAANRHLIRNEGASMSTGQKLWKRAKRVIPGGNMLLSKRAEMFLPGPVAGLLQPGAGLPGLGPGRPRIHRHVDHGHRHQHARATAIPRWMHAVRAIDRCRQHVDAQLPRRGLPGREADRAASVGARWCASRAPAAKPTPSRCALRAPPAARTRSPFCGYHGWHDWYLAANLGDEQNLAGHLLPGPRAERCARSTLRGTVLPFNYNRFDELEALADGARHRRHRHGSVAQPGPGRGLPAARCASWPRVAASC